MEWIKINKDNNYDNFFNNNKINILLCNMHDNIPEYNIGTYLKKGDPLYVGNPALSDFNAGVIRIPEASTDGFYEMVPISTGIKYILTDPDYFSIINTPKNNINLRRD